MRSQAVQRDFHLQAAVVRGDHLVAEARGDQVVGLAQAVVQQPAGAQFAAELLVVGEVQFDRALQRQALRFQRAQREGEGGEVALADRRRAAVELAVVDLGAVGRWVQPSPGGTTSPCAFSAMVLPPAP
jgi:hypothetical protein